MKILAIFLVILAVSSIADSKKHRKSKSKSNNKKSQKVENTQGPIDKFVNPPNAGYTKSAKIVPSISGPVTPKVTANEVTTGTIFYDGSANLATIHVNCDVFSDNKNSCVSNDKCGWCGDRTKCVPGTAFGPLVPCLKTTYIYQTKSETWSPLTAGSINIQAPGIHVIPQN